MAKNGGKPCDPHASAELASCNEQACGQVEYCAWGGWSDYSSCSVTCGSGMKSRSRKLQVTSTKPSAAEDVLVTGILDSLSM